MTTFLGLFLITLLVMVGGCLIINFCKRRTRKTSHGLTGMCHETGGKMCSCCSSKMVHNPPRTLR